MKATDPVYINILHNRSINTIQCDVTAALAYLFITYGKIESEVLREREIKVHEMAYKLMDPLVTIYA